MQIEMSDRLQYQDQHGACQHPYRHLCRSLLPDQIYAEDKNPDGQDPGADSKEAEHHVAQGLSYKAAVACK